MSFGVFESALADDHQSQSRARLATTRLAQAATDVDSKLGRFLSKSENEGDFNNRIALVRKDLTQIVGKYLEGQSGVDAVVAKMKGQYLKPGGSRRRTAGQFEVGDKVVMEGQPGVAEVYDSVTEDSGDVFYMIEWDTGDYDEAPEDRLRHASRRSSRRRTADHWREDTQFQHFLIELYGTTDINDELLIEALEAYAGVGAFSQGVAVEEAPPELSHVSKKRATRRYSYGDLDDYLDFAHNTGRDKMSEETIDDYYRMNSGVDEDFRDEVLDWMGAQKTAKRTAKGVLARVGSYKGRTASSSWYHDTKLNAYVSKVQQKFACGCGESLTVPGYNLCKCGKIWNAYKISSKDQNLYVAREVPVRENVLVAGKKTASRRTAGEYLDPDDLDDRGAQNFFEQYADSAGIDTYGGDYDRIWNDIKESVDYDIITDDLDVAVQNGELSSSVGSRLQSDLESFHGLGTGATFTSRRKNSSRESRRRTAGYFEDGDKVKIKGEPGTAEIIGIAEETDGYRIYEIEWDTGDYDEAPEDRLRHASRRASRGRCPFDRVADRRRASRKKATPWAEGSEPQFVETDWGEYVMEYGDYSAAVQKDGSWAVIRNDRVVGEGEGNGDLDDSFGEVEQWFKKNASRKEATGRLDRLKETNPQEYSDFMETVSPGTFYFEDFDTMYDRWKSQPPAPNDPVKDMVKDFVSWSGGPDSYDRYSIQEYAMEKGLSESEAKALEGGVVEFERTSSKKAADGLKPFEHQTSPFGKHHDDDTIQEYNDWFGGQTDTVFDHFVTDQIQRGGIGGNPEGALEDFLDRNYPDIDQGVYETVYDYVMDRYSSKKAAGNARLAYDVEEDTLGFFQRARGRGYRFPKNMGGDPDSGTFQDELYNYTGGDQDRMDEITDFARDNWGEYRHFGSYHGRRHASDRAFEDPDSGFSVVVDNRGGSEVGVVLDPNGSEIDTIHPFNGEYFEDDMYELTNGLDTWLQDADTDSYRRDFHSKKRES